eukprot:202251-Chlamydomonas_euryale.AAC.4
MPSPLFSLPLPCPRPLMSQFTEAFPPPWQHQMQQPPRTSSPPSPPTFTCRPDATATILRSLSPPLPLPPVHRMRAFVRVHVPSDDHVDARLIKHVLVHRHEALGLLVVLRVAVVGRGVELHDEPRSVRAPHRRQRARRPRVLLAAGVEGHVVVERQQRRGAAEHSAVPEARADVAKLRRGRALRQCRNTRALHAGRNMAFRGGGCGAVIGLCYSCDCPLLQL